MNNIHRIALITFAILLYPFLVLAVQLDPSDPVGLAGALAAALKGGNYWLAAMLGAVVLVWALRKGSGWLSGNVCALGFLSWFLTDRGGTVLGFATGFFLALATSLMAGSSMGLSLILMAITAGLGTIGLFTVGKKVAAPSDKTTA